ncbi:MAG: hypothetical protein J6X43_01040, partial [Bacteroidales bacterium]|nr:hypothetical protein [Bacteroidales bacterium]
MDTTTHLSVKKVLIALIVGLLSSFVVFSQSSDIQWTMHVDNLNVGGTGKITIRGENISNNTITISNILLPMYKGVHNLDYPTGDVIINGNHSSFNPTSNFHIPYEVIQPHSAIELSYSISATCEAIGDSITIERPTTIIYSNDTSKIEDENPFVILHPHIAIQGDAVVVTEGASEADVIFRIDNRSIDAPTENIELQVYFPENAKPQSDNMFATFSVNGVDWSSFILWSEHDSENPWIFRINQDVFRAIGLENLVQGHPLFVKFNVQLASSLISSNIEAKVLFADESGNYCEDHFARTIIPITRTIGNPHLIVEHRVTEFVRCDSTGQVTFILRNQGDGIAHVNSIHLNNSDYEILNIMSNNERLFNVVNRNIQFPNYLMDENASFKDLDGDNIFQEILPSDSVVLRVNYKLKPQFYSFGNVYITLEVNSTNFTNTMEPQITSDFAREIMGVNVQVQDFHLNNSENSFITISSTERFIDEELFGANTFFLCVEFPENVIVNNEGNSLCANDNSPRINLRANLSNLYCDDSFPMQYTFGYTLQGCEDTRVIVENGVRTFSISDDNVELNMNVSDIVTHSISINKNNGYNVNDVPNIPYKGLMQALNQRDNNTTVIYSGDTVEFVFLGLFNDMSGTVSDIRLDIDNFYSVKLNYLGGFCQIGTDILDVTMTTESPKVIVNVNDIPRANGVRNVEVHLKYVIVPTGSVNENRAISASFSMMDTSGWIINRCSSRHNEFSMIFPIITSNSNVNFCASRIQYSNGSGNIYHSATEYYPFYYVRGLSIRKTSEVKFSDLAVLIGGERVPFSQSETDELISLTFNESIGLDFIKRTISVEYQLYNACNTNRNEQIEIRLIMDGGADRVISIPLLKPVINIDGDVVSIRNAGTNQITFNNLTISENNVMESPHNYFRWSSNSLILNSVNILSPDGTIDTIRNESQQDEFIFNVPLHQGETKHLNFNTTFTDCSLDTLSALLQTVVSCSEIDDDAFDTLVMHCYDKTFTHKLDTIYTQSTFTTFESNYKNLCDTLFYEFNINNINVDTSRVSFVLDKHLDNIHIVSVDAFLNQDSFSILGNTSSENYNITTDVYRNTNSNIIDATTKVRVGLSVVCDNTGKAIDISSPVMANVLRYGICNNPIQEDFSIKPNIKGFENMDSIRFTATAVNFDNQGIGTVSVSLQNNDLQLIDSVDFTVILPEGIEFVENSTTPNYFSSIQNDGQSVVWAFERNKHVDGNENLQFTFQVRNANRCERRNDTLKMATSLERTLHGSCSDACLVKKTSDTIQITMQQEPVKLIESITTDKNSVCAGDSFIVSVQDNNNGIYTLSAEPTGMVSIDGNTITTNPQVSGLVTIKVTATDDDCQDEAQTTVTINALPHPVIRPITQNFIEKGQPRQLFASPDGGVWSGTEMESSGLFRAEHSGVHTIYYTVTNGECSNSDSVQITVVSCDKEIFIEPDSLNVSEQASIITIPVSISPIEECGYCSELRSMKFNITFDDDVLDYSGVELQQLQQSVDMYDRLENNTVVVQLYSNTENGFVTDGGELLYLTFHVKRIANTVVSISNGYYNGESASENLTDDMIIISYMSKPTVTLHDTIFCAGGQVELVPIVENPSNSELSYEWESGQTTLTTPTITVSTAGVYKLTVSDGFGSKDSTQIVVSEAPAIVAELADTAFCEGTDITIQPNITQGEIAQYEWNTGENTASVNVTTAGTYTVTLADVYGCTTEVSANVAVNENNEIPVFSYNRNSMDSYTATISNAIENNVYMWHGSEGVTFDSNQASSVTISVSSYPAAICVESQDENGCTSVSYCDTIPLTPPINIAGNRVICFSQQEPVVTTDYRINEPKFNAQYEWEVTNNAQLFQHNAQEAAIQFRVGMGTVSLTVRERINGEITRETTIAIEQRIRPNDLYYQNLGDNNVCNTAENVIYTVSGNASEYHWEVPANAEIVSGQGTNRIAVNFNGTSGNIVVHAQNGEGCLSYGGVYYSVNVNGDCPPQEYTLKSLTLNDEEQGENENIAVPIDLAETYLNVYPLPVKHILTISTNATIQRVIVYDIVGGIVM